MSRFDHLAKQLEELAVQGRRRELVSRRAEGAWIVLADGRRLINFGGNDYLGLASESTLNTRCGSGASPLVCGWTGAHERLAESIARFEGTEAAVLFSSGFAACCGTVATLAQEHDLILSDQWNHASLIDGCRLSRAQRMIFRHRDLDDLESLLAKFRKDYQHVWMVTDGVFSMDGHVAPLRGLCDLAERFDANLIVDEAHATGVLGAAGGGVCEALGVKDRVPIRIGTLSKAIGGQGGFVAAPRVVVDFLINRCRTLIYSTALSPAAVGAADAALTRICAEPERRTHLRRLSQRMRDFLGIKAESPEDVVPIIPIVVGADVRAVEASRRLAEAGFYVPAIRPPTVAEGTARLRISLSFLHDEAMIESLIDHLQSLVCRL